jgi:predicted nicotinamide N-methyase
MATNTLAALKFTTAKKPAQLSPIQSRRSKLIAKLEEQILLAGALAEGRIYAPTKTKVVVDETSGEKRSVETAKRMKQWWFATDNGKIALTVRYGAKVLELVKGKNAIEVASASELVKTLELVKTATAAGELDDTIAAASAKLRDGFVK